MKIGRPAGNSIPKRDQARMIVPGIDLSDAGSARVSSEMGRQLIELALALESYTPHPVDVQHVLAAIVIAVRNGDIPPGVPLPPPDRQWLEVLAGYVKSVFQQTGGRVSEDD